MVVMNPTGDIAVQQRDLILFSTGVMLLVVVPVMAPTLMVLGTFFFIWTWNEFFLPLIFLVSSDNQTVPVALAVLQGDRLMDATTTSASGVRS